MWGVRKMIIVSQDKDNIVNFDNMTSIWIDDNILDKTNAYFEICADDESLGYYKTEERAKEVLQEIILLFKDEEMFHINKSTLNNLDELAEPKYILRPVNRPKVYEMPEE